MRKTRRQYAVDERAHAVRRVVGIAILTVGACGVLQESAVAVTGAPPAPATAAVIPWLLRRGSRRPLPSRGSRWPSSQRSCRPAVAGRLRSRAGLDRRFAELAEDRARGTDRAAAVDRPGVGAPVGRVAVCRELAGPGCDGQAQGVAAPERGKRVLAVSPHWFVATRGPSTGPGPGGSGGPGPGMGGAGPVAGSPGGVSGASSPADATAVIAPRGGAVALPGVGSVSFGAASFESPATVRSGRRATRTSRSNSRVTRRSSVPTDACPTSCASLRRPSR